MQINMSDTAYEHLCELAVQLHYIIATPHRKRQHGLHLYVAALGEYGILRDARPEYVRELDQPLLEAGRVPIWMPEYTRRRRLIAINNTVAEQCYKKAYNLGITNHRRSESVESFGSVISAMLEAIGVGWLLVDNIPMNPDPHKKRATNSDAVHY